MVVIVTSGSSGLRFAGAQQHLAGEASNLILACRTVSKREIVRLELLEDPEIKRENLNGKVSLMKAGYGTLREHPRAWRTSCKAFKIIVASI